MSQVTLRFRKQMTNRVLQRKQMVLDVIHPGMAGVSKADLRKKIADLHKVQDEARIVLFGFRYQFGGGKTSGFCLIYDDVEAKNKYTPKHLLVRHGDATATTRPARAQRKTKKNRDKTFRGTLAKKNKKTKKRQKN